MLGGGTQDAEHFVGGAVALAHDDAERLVDDAARPHGGLHLVGELLGVTDPLGQGDALARLKGQGAQSCEVGVGERVGRVGVEEEIAYFLAYAPPESVVADLVQVAGMRWQIEECFQAAKNECGLDQYEVRRYVGWYRHITLAMLAHAYLAVMAADAAAKGGAETLLAPWLRSPWQKSGGCWRLASPGTTAVAGGFTRTC